MQRTPATDSTMDWLCSIGLLGAEERKVVAGMFDPRFPFAAAVQLADSIHLHIRVEDTEALPREDFQAHGGTFDRGQPGYLKYCFPDGLNVIFSSIPVAQETAPAPGADSRPRPHLDHLGIDLRQENDIVQSGFKRIPDKARSLRWGHVAQGGKNQPVACCHIEVAAKHWVYPPEGAAGPAVPLEFSYGPLKSLGTVAGDDLRPAAPVVQLAAVARKSCC